LLSRVSALGNYCCEMPVGQDETVYVFAAKEVKITYDPLRIFKVVGVFEAGMHADAAYGPSLFRVRNATVEDAATGSMTCLSQPRRSALICSTPSTANSRSALRRALSPVILS